MGKESCDLAEGDPAATGDETWRSEGPFQVGGDMVRDFAGAGGVFALPLTRNQPFIYTAVLLYHLGRTVLCFIPWLQCTCGLRTRLLDASGVLPPYSSPYTSERACPSSEAV